MTNLTPKQEEENKELEQEQDVFVKMGLTKDPIANQLNKLFECITK